MPLRLMTAFEPVILSCLTILGAKKYDLPAYFVASIDDYACFFRPYPVIHHYIKNKSFELQHPELILVHLQACHVISIALAGSAPVDIYININAPAQRNNQGFEWIDLEIDVKATVNHNNEFVPIVVDCDEFDKHVHHLHQQHMAEQEVNSILNQLALKKFPFNFDEITQFAEQHLSHCPDFIS